MPDGFSDLDNTGAGVAFGVVAPGGVVVPPGEGLGGPLGETRDLGKTTSQKRRNTSVALLLPLGTFLCGLGVVGLVGVELVPEVVLREGVGRGVGQPPRTRPPDQLHAFRVAYNSVQTTYDAFLDRVPRLGPTGPLATPTPGATHGP